MALAPKLLYKHPWGSGLTSITESCRHRDRAFSASKPRSLERRLVAQKECIVKIAQVAPLIESVPPQAYGGTERMVHYLTEGLVARGHDVTLFASGDSQTTADHVAVVKQSLRLSKRPRDPTIWHMCQLMEVLRRAHHFDIIHFHTDWFHFPVWRNVSTPQLTTLHGRLDIPDLRAVYDEFRDMAVVSISDSQRTPMPSAGWVETIYNGTPAGNYHFCDRPGDYLAFLGRITPEKGPEQAIEIAKRLGMPLKMAAKIDPIDREYFAARIEPLLDDPLIDFLGEVDERGKDTLLGGARALLFPIDWPEPFGLVMTEAMACGTPVIAMRRGSVPEIMIDGVTGFIVNSIDEAVAAVQKIGTIDRANCRQHFEQNFTVGRMVDSYVETYKRLIKSGPLPIAQTSTVGSLVARR